VFVQKRIFPTDLPARTLQWNFQIVHMEIALQACDPAGNGAGLACELLCRAIQQASC
jgi:hypothetical protein